MYIKDNPEATSIIMNSEAQSVTKADLKILQPYLIYYLLSGIYKIGYKYSEGKIAIFNDVQNGDEIYNAFSVFPKEEAQILDEISNIVIKNASDVEDSLYNTISARITEINSYKREIRKQKTELKAAEKAYAAAKNEEINLDFKNTINSDGILRIEFNLQNNELHLYTDFIQATVYDRSMDAISKIYIGKTKMRVDLVNYRLYCEPVNLASEGYNDRLIAHPHVMSHHNCCLGSYQTAFDGAVQSGNIHEIIMVALLWVTSVQSNDDAGRYHHRWERTEEENALIEKKYGDTMFRGFACG